MNKGMPGAALVCLFASLTNKVHSALRLVLLRQFVIDMFMVK